MKKVFEIEVPDGSPLDSANLRGYLVGTTYIKGFTKVREVKNCPPCYAPACPGPVRPREQTDEIDHCLDCAIHEELTKERERSAEWQAQAGRLLARVDEIHVINTGLSEENAKERKNCAAREAEVRKLNVQMAELREEIADKTETDCLNCVDHLAHEGLDKERERSTAREVQARRDSSNMAKLAKINRGLSAEIIKEKKARAECHTEARKRNDTMAEMAKFNSQLNADLDVADGREVQWKSENVDLRKALEVARKQEVELRKGTDAKWRTRSHEQIVELRDRNASLLKANIELNEESLSVIDVNTKFLNTNIKLTKENAELKEGSSDLIDINNTLANRISDLLKENDQLRGALDAAKAEAGDSDRWQALARKHGAKRAKSANDSYRELSEGLETVKAENADLCQENDQLRGALEERSKENAEEDVLSFNEANEEEVEDPTYEEILAADPDPDHDNRSMEIGSMLDYQEPEDQSPPVGPPQEDKCTYTGLQLEWPEGIDDPLKLLLPELEKLLSVDKKLHIVMPCGHSVAYRTCEIPSEDISCSCGNPNHWFVRLKHTTE